MGKKKRVLKNPKFAKLRTHPKYRNLVAANEQKNKEPNEATVETLAKEPEISEELPKE